MVLAISGKGRMVLSMNLTIPSIIQGGMGAGVSNWRLAKAVARLGQLGVVAGTALDQLLSLRSGERRRRRRHPPRPGALSFPRGCRILDAYFVPGGQDPSKPRKPGKCCAERNLPAQELCIAANFVEVFLAREGHWPRGNQFLEKSRCRTRRRSTA